MLFQSTAPLNLWMCATATAAYTITRLPSAALDGDIPYARWTGHPLKSLSHLRVWGCPVFWKTDILKAKRDSRSREGIFVGYATASLILRLDVSLSIATAFSMRHFR